MVPFSSTQIRPMTEEDDVIDRKEPISLLNRTISKQNEDEGSFIAISFFKFSH